MKVTQVRTQPLKSSFLSIEKDSEQIIKKLFVENQPYSDILKSLLVINTKDCLSNLGSEKYQQIVRNTSVSDLVEKQYIRFVPKLYMQEFEDVKAYIIISFDNFTEGSNPQFRDSLLSFDIFCSKDCWVLDNYQLRPLKIAGYIDGILHNAKLTGIGTLQFFSCARMNLDEDLAGYSLIFQATHGSDDEIPPREE